MPQVKKKIEKRREYAKVTLNTFFQFQFLPSALLSKICVKTKKVKSDFQSIHIFNHKLILQDYWK